VDTEETGPFGPLVERFDERVDELFEPLRANAKTDRMFYWASTAGDFSAIWHVCAISRAVLPAGRWRDAARLSTIVGVESLLVNQGIKRLFGRVRPQRSDDAGDRHIRQPITSSFPSGHASAAMTAAAVLSRGNRLGPLYYAAGVVVAASRIHVKMHHASDVVAGAATGLVLGAVATRVLDRLDRV